MVVMVVEASLSRSREAKAVCQNKAGAFRLASALACGS